MAASVHASNNEAVEPCWVSRFAIASSKDVSSRRKSSGRSLNTPSKWSRYSFTLANVSSGGIPRYGWKAPSSWYR